MTHATRRRALAVHSIEFAAAPARLEMGRVGPLRDGER
jgi:hypothetical protein